LRRSRVGAVVSVIGIVSFSWLLFGWAAKPAAAVPLPEPAAADTATPPTRLQMQNVDFYDDPQIPLRIRKLVGTNRSRTCGPHTFDDKQSFIIHVDAGEVGLTGADLSLLLNKYVFNYKGSPLRNVKVSTSGSEIIQKGTLHKVFPMPFEIRASLSVTPDGRIRIHPTRTEILGLHVDKLMQGLGLALDEVINLKKSKGASVSGNDIFLDPTIILPPPQIEGRVTGVRVEGAEVVQTFGPAGAIAMGPTPDATQRNYMFYRGGTLQFGKLMMLDAEMLITELDPVDPFRFELDNYTPQLVAGYSKTLNSGGLEVFVRDRDKLTKPPVP
jgi:hypothetical protein